jgi:two-component sensor histidine kinase
MLNPRTAQTFALLVHELATNAVKYGALSHPEKGKVAINWSIEGAGKEARFKFQWQERDGPSCNLSDAPRLRQLAARKGCCTGFWCAAKDQICA